jgi:hypothetical protein
MAPSIQQENYPQMTQMFADQETTAILLSENDLRDS